MKSYNKPTYLDHGTNDIWHLAAIVDQRHRIHLTVVILLH